MVAGAGPGCADYVGTCLEGVALRGREVHAQHELRGHHRSDRRDGGQGRARGVFGGRFHRGHVSSTRAGRGGRFWCGRVPGGRGGGRQVGGAERRHVEGDAQGGSEGSGKLAVRRGCLEQDNEDAAGVARVHGCHRERHVDVPPHERQAGIREDTDGRLAGFASGAHVLFPATAAGACFAQPPSPPPCVAGSG